MTPQVVVEKLTEFIPIGADEAVTQGATAEQFANRVQTSRFGIT